MYFLYDCYKLSLFSFRPPSCYCALMTLFLVTRRREITSRVERRWRNSRGNRRYRGWRNKSTERTVMQQMKSKYTQAFICVKHHSPTQCSHQKAICTVALCCVIRPEALLTHFFSPLAKETTPDWIRMCLC